MSLFDQPIENGEPVFKEPWEAQAFSLVIALHESGVFSWSEWSDALAQAIRRDLHPGGLEDVAQRVSEAVGEDGAEDEGEKTGEHMEEKEAEVTATISTGWLRLNILRSPRVCQRPVNWR